MNARFSGKVVLVAGGTGGLGRAVTVAFLHEGAEVVVTYRNQNELDAVRRTAGENPKPAAHLSDDPGRDE